MDNIGCSGTNTYDESWLIGKSICKPPYLLASKEDFEIVEKFIEKFRKDKDFTGGIDEDKIKIIEKQLNVTLPESYKWFLRKYGSGGIFSIDILGWILEGHQ